MGTTRRARERSGAGRRVPQAKSRNALIGGGRMKRKDFPHVAKQTHEVFHHTTSSLKKDSKIGYSGRKPRGRELVLGIPRMPTHKTHAQTPAYQFKLDKVLLKEIHLGLA